VKGNEVWNSATNGGANDFDRVSFITTPAAWGKGNLTRSVRGEGRVRLEHELSIGGNQSVKLADGQTRWLLDSVTDDNGGDVEKWLAALPATRTPRTSQPRLCHHYHLRPKPAGRL
jgi:hypothetical protein